MINSVKAIWLFLGLSVICQIANAQEALPYPSNEQLRHYRSVFEPRLSPDGTQVLVRIADSVADGAKGHIWLVPVNGGEPRQLTFSRDSDKEGEGTGRWMPDGMSILFLAHRGEHTGLYMLPLSGGEAKPIPVKIRPLVDESKRPDALPPVKDSDKTAATEPAAEMEVDVDSYNVSPDGKFIALILKDPETPGEKKQKEAKADAQWVDHDEHGTRLYLLELATDRITEVPVAINVKEASWSEDGSQLIVVAERPNSASDLGPARSAWQVTLADLARPQRLNELPATIELPRWSSDGHAMLYLAQAKRDAPPDYYDLYEYTFATRTSRNLTDGLDGSIGPEQPLRMPDGSCVFVMIHGVESGVAQILPNETKPRLVKLPMTDVIRVSTNATRTGWVFLGNSGGQGSQLYFLTDLGATPKQLPLPPLTPAHLQTTAPKLISWKNGGMTIQGLLYLPPQSAKGPVPLIVQVHGGPTGVFLNQFDPFVDFLLGQGWAVLNPNPRGSVGRGAAFAAAVRNDVGGADYRDVMSGVDYVLKTEPIDPSRLALMGYSYGGEMAGFAEGRTQRFKAIISGAPVIDQYSEYGTEDDSWYDRWYFGKPWEHPSDAWRQSPLAGVGHAKTPFLLIQGQSDTTDPVGQSQEMYRALRQMNVPVDLVTYPRVDHAPLAIAISGNPSAEPWHGFDARRRIVSFIGKAFGVTPCKLAEPKAQALPASAAGTQSGRSAAGHQGYPQSPCVFPARTVADHAGR